MKYHRIPLALSVASALSLVARAAAAVDADPSNYQSILPTLQPGDTLHLAAGTYTGGLDVSNLDGTAGMPIVIEGAGDTTVFEGDACCNTVEITNSSHVVIRKIKIDGKGIDGVFGVSAKGGAGNVVHHITIEDCTFVGQGASQQTVAISTKTPTFGWIIRRNVIEGAGTGMYLGNSDHTMPFVGGLIEHNLVKNPIGYPIQIKDQDPWPDHPALPETDSRTLVRHNVLIKGDQASPDGPRPNLMIGGQPPSGPGAGDSVEVYGNLIVHNSVDEALIQATGRVSIHDNILVDGSDEGILLTPHDGFPVLRAFVYNNTIHATKRAVVLGAAAVEGDGVIGNLLFAPTPVEGNPMNQKDNVTDSVANAGMYVTAPSTMLGQMDFFPKEGSAAAGAAMDLSMFSGDVAPNCDFNGLTKGKGTFRGAYAASGSNPGWPLDAQIKTLYESCGAGGGGTGGSATGGSGAGGSGAGGSATGGAGGSDSGAGAAGTYEGESSSCGCRVGASSRGDGLAILGLSLLLLARRRNNKPR